MSVPAQDILHSTEYAHFALDRREERLQPIIRGGIRKVAGEDLGRARLRGRATSEVGGTHLEARSLFDDLLLRSRRHAVLGDRGGGCGGGVRHFGGGGSVGFS